MHITHMYIRVLFIWLDRYDRHKSRVVCKVVPAPGRVRLSECTGSGRMVRMVLISFVLKYVELRRSSEK
jgi:hypothetical protein